MSPGPHSANASPGTAEVTSEYKRALLFSILIPNKSSPDSFKGHGSAFCMYSSGEIPQISDALFWPPAPLRPSPNP